MARGMRNVLIPDEQDELAGASPRSASRWAVLAAIAGGATLALGPAAAIVHAADSGAYPGGYGDAFGFDDGSGTGGVALLAPSSETMGLANAGSPKTAGSPQKVRNPKRAASAEPQARAEQRASAQERAAASRQAEARRAAQPGPQSAAERPVRAQSQAKEKEKEKDRKVGICHATGSDSNPFVFIVVDEHAVDAHQRHQEGRDVIGVSTAADCPAAALVLGGQAESPQTAKSPKKVRAESPQTVESPKTVKTATARSPQSPTGTPTGTATTASPATATATATGVSPQTASPGTGATATTATATTAGPATIEQQLQQLSQQRQASQDDEAEQSPLVAGVSAEAEAGLELTPGEAAILAALLGGGLTAEDVQAMTMEEIAQAADARGLAPTAVLGAAAAAAPDDQADAPSALPQTGGPGLPLGAALGFGAMLAAAGAVLRRVMQR